MAKHNWALQDEVTNPSTLPVMHIASANSGLRDMDSNIAIISQLWDVSILDGNIFYGVEDKCGVLAGSAMREWDETTQQLTTSALVTEGDIFDL